MELELSERKEAELEFSERKEAELGTYLGMFMPRMLWRWML